MPVCPSVDFLGQKLWIFVNVIILVLTTLFGACHVDLIIYTAGIKYILPSSTNVRTSEF